MTDSEKFLNVVLPKLKRIEEQLKEEKKQEMSKYDLKWATTVFNNSKGGANA